MEKISLFYVSEFFFLLILSVSEIVPSIFRFFGGIASWFGLSDRSFNGRFLFFPDSKAFISLFYLSVFVVGLVGFSERKMSVIVLGNILSMCGLLFFVSTNFFSSLCVF